MTKEKNDPANIKFVSNSEWENIFRQTHEESNIQVVENDNNIVVRTIIYKGVVYISDYEKDILRKYGCNKFIEEHE